MCVRVCGFLIWGHTCLLITLSGDQDRGQDQVCHLSRSILAPAWGHLFPAPVLCFLSHVLPHGPLMSQPFPETRGLGVWGPVESSETEGPWSLTLLLVCAG